MVKKRLYISYILSLNNDTRNYYLGINKPRTLNHLTSRAIDYISKLDSYMFPTAYHSETVCRPSSSSSGRRLTRQRSKPQLSSIQLTSHYNALRPRRYIASRARVLSDRFRTFGSPPCSLSVDNDAGVTKATIWENRSIIVATAGNSQDLEFGS